MAQDKNFVNKIIGLLILLVPPVLSTLVSGIEEAGGFEELAASLTGIMTLTVLVSEPIKNKLDLEGWGARIITWVVATGLIYFSSLAGWAFESYQWFMYILSGVGVGLASNGVFTIEQVKSALQAVYSILNNDNK